MKLSNAQIAALRKAGKGECHYHPSRRMGFTQATIDVLRERGLLVYDRAGCYAVTPAGRQAFLEATGEE